MSDGHDEPGGRVADDRLTARVAVITVSFGSDLVLPDFLDSIPTAMRDLPLVVVVDNKPEPASSVRADAERRVARYLPVADNPGYGAAVNRGVVGLPPTVEWILISNPDVILRPGALDRLVEIGESDARIGMVGPAILNSDGSVYPSARAIPSIGNGIGHALFANLWPSNPWTRRYHQDAVGSEPRRTGWLSGACVLVRRSAFDAVGGFDEDYFMYFEDVDLGYRIGRSGFDNVYAPAAAAEHLGAHSTSTQHASMIRAHHQSARRFIATRYAGARYAPLRAGLGLGLRVRAYISTLANRSS